MSRRLRVDRALRLAVAAAGAVALFLPPAAAATDVTRAEFQSLAARAGKDPRALAELRAVDSVDGKDVDLERALAGATRVELRQRLRALSSRRQAAGPPARVRGRAAKILSERRFQEESTPRPFRRPLKWLSTPVRRASEALGRLARWLAGPLPGGTSTFWTLLALLVCATAAVFALRIARSRTAPTGGPSRRSGRPARLDPSRLEREADEAELSGEYEQALRLRFRAGLIRLGLAEAIPLRDSLTSGEVRRRLRQPEFDELATAFDEVVYGGRRPERSDVEHARAGWPRLLRTVGAQ